MSRLAAPIASSLFLLVVAAHSPGRATTQQRVSLEELARASDVIVLGTVVETLVHTTGPGGVPGLHTRVDVASEQILAGPPVSRVTFWVHGGRRADRIRVLPGQARFRVGERVVAFLFASHEDALWPTGMALGKWAVEEAGGRSVAIPGTSSALGSPTEHAPGTTETALPLDELIARVRAARGTP